MSCSISFPLVVYIAEMLKRHQDLSFKWFSYCSWNPFPLDHPVLVNFKSFLTMCISLNHYLSALQLLKSLLHSGISKQINMFLILEISDSSFFLYLYFLSPFLITSYASSEKAIGLSLLVLLALWSLPFSPEDSSHRLYWVTCQDWPLVD